MITTRFILRDTGAHPEKLESGVRKWLTYVALLIAARVVIGDLITFLSYFLRGELTPRFILKVITVLYDRRRHILVLPVFVTEAREPPS